MKHNTIYIKGGTALIVDYGGQYTHLIARRLRELGVLSFIEPYTNIFNTDLSKYSAIILSGSHRSSLQGDPLVEEVARKILFDTNTPVLGICFGHQLIAKILGGRVKSGCREYGRVLVKIVVDDALFRNWSRSEYVWMSHGDCVEEVPDNGVVLAYSENNYIAAVKYTVNNRPVYTVQFHPEVSHTVKGLDLLNNFIDIAGLKREWTRDYYFNTVVSELEKYKSVDGPVISAISGGIDSTIATYIARRVLGDRVIPVFVNHGLFRYNEPEEVVEMLSRIGLNPMVVDASESFLSRLEGVRDCEERRRIIGEEFAKIFDEIMEEENAELFIQGTTYPDIVESGMTGVADKIKSHHNVAGIPGWFREKYVVVEPLKYLYKDEIREIARMLGLPDYFVKRHPFPGPGLAVRVIGEFNRKKLEICRIATYIVEEALRKHGLYDKVWQAFAVVGDDKWIGVKGDSRRIGYIVTIRIVESTDAMTADYSKIPYYVLDEISSRITREIDEVTMVTYAVTTKPPSTIEPC